MFKIAISGKARTGKNTVGKLLIDKLPGKMTNIAFADPIKKMALCMFPNIPEQYLYGKSEYRSEIIPGAFKGASPLTIRQLLIDIGTELGRSYKEDVWLDAFDYACNQALQHNSSVIVTDVRFRNEFDHLKKMGFFQIRVLRNTSSSINHISETNQDSIKNEEFDYIVNNNSSIDILNTEVDKIIEILLAK